MTIAVVGDHNPDYFAHQFTDQAFAYLGAEIRWIPTPDLERDPSQLDDYAGVVISPGSPYASTEGVLSAIQYSRENNLPLLANCGGFQHVVLELARNVLGLRDAEHAQNNPDGHELVVIPLACSLVGLMQQVEIRPNTIAASLYGVSESTEAFYCSYGINPDYRVALEDAGVRFSGFDQSGEIRILELPEHRFFLATLFVPQATSGRETPHPILTGFVEECRLEVARPL